MGKIFSLTTSSICTEIYAAPVESAGFRLEIEKKFIQDKSILFGQIEVKFFNFRKKMMNLFMSRFAGAVRVNIFHDIAIGYRVKKM